MRRSYDEAKYIALGDSKGLDFVPPKPHLVSQPAKWKCKFCGSDYEKTYRVVSVSPMGCSCQSPLALPEEAYIACAKDFELTWVRGQYRPKNTKVRTTWKKKDGTTFLASYYEMKYRMPTRVKKELGLLNV